MACTAVAYYTMLCLLHIYIYTESIYLLLSQKSGSMLYIHRCVSSPAPPNPSYTSDVSAPNEVYVTLLVVARAVSRKRHGLGASREMLIYTLMASVKAGFHRKLVDNDISLDFVTA